MASNIKTLKVRISSTKTTAQITKAMNLVSAAKLKVAEANIQNYLLFTSKLKQTFENVISDLDSTCYGFEEREVKKTCYIVITSERGLAGPFNNNLFKLLLNEINDKDVCVAPLGSRGYNFCKKTNLEMIYDELYYLKDDVSFSDIFGAVEKILISYSKKEIDKVCVIYNHYVNSLTQIPTVVDLLPLKKNDNSKHSSYEFDGGIDNILDTLIPLYIENILYGYILDSKASEYAARMTAMKSATDNANEVIEKLQLLYNRARQSAITLELTDIISGANAINQN